MNSTFTRLLKVAWPVRTWMALSALIGTATVLSGIGLAATSAYLISEAALHPSVAALSIAIVGVRFFGIARGAFRYLERLVSHRAAFRLLADMRVWFYKALVPLVPARLMTLKNGVQQELRSGDILRRAVSDIDMLQNFYIRVLAPPIIAALVALILWLFLGVFGGLFGLVYLGFFLLSSIVVPSLAHLSSKRLGQQMVVTRADLQAQLVDSVQGIADLVAFGQEQRQAAHIQALTKKLNRMQMAMAFIGGTQNALTSFFMNMTAWVMLFIAIPFVHSGQLDGLFLALLVLSALASFEIVLPLPNTFQQLGSNLKAASRLFEIVDAQPTVVDVQQPAPLPQDTTITVEHLNFRYATDEPYVLQDISLTLKPDECVMLVGPSGSGKSTLTHVLLRFFDYEEGRIILGDRDLRDYRQDDLYKLVSVVEQDTHLFNTSIRANLMLARPEASEEEMIEAAQKAQLHEFVQTLPYGYDTEVGEQGLRLSGGERQRVAIARAFLKDTPIVMLDEPTVNLDAIAEQSVLHAIQSLRQGRATLMVTHRLTAMDMANEILVLQDGYVSERGTHKQLLQNEAAYWHMWQQQRFGVLEQLTLQ
ncbi:MAG: thiol reductant ABC exporter subunit CydC [Ktedonobacteraceae bacterium]